MTCFCKRTATLLLPILAILAFTSCQQDIPVANSSPGSNWHGPNITSYDCQAFLPLVLVCFPGWRRLDTTGGGAQTGIATHPTNPDIAYISSDNGGLFRTENGGDSWFSASSMHPVYETALWLSLGLSGKLWAYTL